MVQAGLLWDSVSKNMGDEAVGILLQRALTHAKVPWQVVDPFNPEVPPHVSVMVIGGGELIRAPGHPYYDVFRVPGRHILNTVGVLDGQQTEYLADYAIVTSRSQADRARLGGQGDVSPCLTLLYESYLPSNSTLTVDVPEGALGVQLHAFTGMTTQQIYTLLNGLRERWDGPVLWLPINHYNADHALMSVFAQFVPGSTVLPLMPPDQVFQVIGKLKGVICGSLHNMLFAYTQGVPFLAQTAARKLSHFLEDRDLLQWAVFDEQDILDRLSLLQQPSPHSLEELAYRRSLDHATCSQTLNRIFAHIETSDRDSERSFSIPAGPRGAHQIEVGSYFQLGSLAAKLTSEALAHYDALQQLNAELPYLIRDKKLRWLWRLLKTFQVLLKSLAKNFRRSASNTQQQKEHK